MNEFLFAYGTLNPAMAPAQIRHVVSQLREVCKATARGWLLHLGEYPGGIFSEESATLVHGTVYQLPNENLREFLAQLDEYEGVNSQHPAMGLYLRKRIQVVRENGTATECWAYEYIGDSRFATVIEDGVFRG